MEMDSQTLLFELPRAGGGLRTIGNTRVPASMVCGCTYAITETGLQSVFPITERDVKVISSVDAVDHPFALEVTGLPNVIRERSVTECTITATNTSRNVVAVRPEVEWFKVESSGADFIMRHKSSRQLQPV